MDKEKKKIKKVKEKKRKEERLNAAEELAIMGIQIVCL